MNVKNTEALAIEAHRDTLAVGVPIASVRQSWSNRERLSGGTVVEHRILSCYLSGRLSCCVRHARGLITALLGRRRASLPAVEIRGLVDSELSRIESTFLEPGSAPTVEDLQQQAEGEVNISIAWAGPKPVAVGFIRWGSPRSRELQGRWLDTPEIYRLHVLEESRLLGLGTKMVQYKEKLARQRGCGRVGLGVHQVNRRAHQLYLRLGYVPDHVPFCDEYTAIDASGHLIQRNEVSTFMVKNLPASESEGQS